MGFCVALTLLSIVMGLGAEIGVPAGLKAEDTERYTWVLLNTGERVAMTPEVAQERQAAHLANFTRLAEKGELFAAGPLGDNGFTRGIVLLKRMEAAQLAEAFEPDPFVKNGQLALETLPIVSPKGMVHKGVEPFELEQMSLALLNRTEGGEADVPTIAAHRTHLKGMLDRGEIAFIGGVEGDGKRMAVLLLWEKDPDKLALLLAADPLVQAGAASYEVHPQYLGKGIFRPTAK